MADAPLKGVRVLELARILAGPWAGQTLADLGADVIKVENPDGGDDTRSWGPPFMKGADGDDLDAAYYHGVNRNKRSVVADLKSPEGQEFVRRLAAQSDILIENFKTGGLAKYGLDYQSLRKVNPKLIYCSITGFGHTGPYAAYAGYDFIVQGMSGLMSITGESDGQPMKAGVAVADLFTGIYSVIGILAALRHAEATGQGQHIDMALLDAQAGVLANQNMNYLATGVSPKRIGNENPNIVPYEVVPVADGHIILAVGNDGQFERACKILGLDALPADPRFATNEARVKNRELLRTFITPATQRFAKKDLLSACEANAVPVGTINSIGEMFEDEQIKARGLRIDLKDFEGNAIPGVRTPIVMSQTPLRYDTPSPRLGQHTDEVIAELELLEKGGPRQV
jgi:crotonobetainyl-CoA:carnitine CoA-transferase CaiB-like acyl-CoA transferase